MAITDYDFILTRNEVINAALRKVGALYPGESPRAEELSAAIDALHAMVDDWQNQHVFLWAQSPQTLVLVAGTDSYALNTDPHIFSIEKAYYRDSGGDDCAIEVISWAEYQDIEDKDRSGEPDCIAINHTTSPQAYLWPVPDTNAATGTIFYLGLARLQDFDSASNIGGFTQRWQQALIWGLAAELAPEYGVKISEQRNLDAKAYRFFVRAQGGDRDRPTSDVVKGAY